MAKKKGKASGGSVPETPTCNCLLLCDDVLVSQARPKHILQGIIGTIVVGELPAAIGPYVAYIRFSNVYGTQKITVSLAVGDTDERIFEFVAESHPQSDPLGVYTLVVQVPPFKVTRSGRYMLTALCGGDVLAQSPILVVALSETKENP